MASIGKVPLELFQALVIQPIIDNRVSATCKLRLVSRKYSHRCNVSSAAVLTYPKYFNSNILDNILTLQPPSTFWNKDALGVLVHYLYRFILIVNDSTTTRGFDTTLINRINVLMDFLISHVTFMRREALYPVALKNLCKSLSMIMKGGCRWCDHQLWPSPPSFTAMVGCLSGYEIHI
jgi:hypothetical protein